jgi:hypothetical protein
VTPDLIEALRTGPAAAEIARLVDQGLGETDLLATITSLRKRHRPEVAAAIAETALLRLRASAKFPDPSRMLFDRAGLEQATPLAVARHRAQQFTVGSLIIDLGCGIGGDAIAFTGRAAVVGVDRDVGRVRLAEHNCGVAGGPHGFHGIVGDSMTLAPFKASVVFADPARRTEGRRLRGLASYLPPVDALIERWRPHADTMAIKVAPGIEDHEIPADASVEWVSLDGSLREAVLWIGAGATRRRATALPSGASVTGPEPEGISITPIDRYIHEPDDAVIRAGLVRRVAADIGAAMIDPAIAYLTSSRAVDHPLVTTHRVDEVIGFNLKDLRKRLVELDVGVVTIKKRGSPITPEELRPRLRLRGSRSATIFLTRTSQGPIVAIGLD